MKAISPNEAIDKACLIIGRLTLQNEIQGEYIGELKATGLFPGDKETADVIRQMGETDGQPGDSAPTQ